MLRCASSFVTAAYAKYASFLSIRTPCLRPFYDAVCKWRLLRLFMIPSELDKILLTFSAKCLTMRLNYTVESGGRKQRAEFPSVNKKIQ